MKRMLMVAGLVVAAAMPTGVNAQSMGAGMMKPTMEQCQGGYKRMYMKSMKWSKGTFNRACRGMMGDKMKTSRGKKMGM